MSETTPESVIDTDTTLAEVENDLDSLQDYLPKEVRLGLLDGPHAASLEGTCAGFGLLNLALQYGTQLLPQLGVNPEEMVKHLKPLLVSLAKQTHEQHRLQVANLPAEVLDQARSEREAAKAKESRDAELLAQMFGEGK